MASMCDVMELPLYTLDPVTIPTQMEELKEQLQQEQKANKVLRDNYDVLLKQIERIKWNLRDVSLERKSKLA